MHTQESKQIATLSALLHALFLYSRPLLKMKGIGCLRACRGTGHMPQDDVFDPCKACSRSTMRTSTGDGVGGPLAVSQELVEEATRRAVEKRPES